MDQLPRYFGARLPLLACALSLGGWLSLSQERVAGSDEGALRSALGAASETEVTTFVWEPRRSLLREYLTGRPLLFVGRQGSRPRDVFRAFVRFSPRGVPLAVRDVRNLTDTRLSDESSLIANRELALYATEQDGRVRSLTAVLWQTNDEARLGFLGRLERAFGNLAQLGEFRGLERTDVFLATPAARVSVTAQGAALALQLDAGTAKLGQADLRGERVARAEGVRVVHREVEAISLLQWGVDSARRWLGPGPVAFVEGRWFSLADWLHRATRPSSPERREARPIAPARAEEAADSNEWPPRALDPALEGSPSGDGQWRAWTFEPSQARKSSPYFFRTVLHPDAQRPYAEVHLVAIDTSRLELHARAGYEDPKPEAGPPGSGHIPDDEPSYRRVVATFNGAFKAVHGAYGMQAEGRLLVAPTAGSATIRIDDDGGIGFGSWPTNDQGQAASPESLPGLLEFRQNLDPLVAGGQANPRRRAVWGEHLFGSLVPAERSALCATRQGQLIYAWSPEISAEALAAALVRAECVYALHLDMNPGHCTFAQNRVDSFEPLKARGQVLDSRMRVNENRYLRWSPQDFFYLAERTSLPATSRLTWQLSDPNGPALGPAVARGQAGSLPIEIDRIPLYTASFVVQPGSSERPTEVPRMALPQALLGFGLGHRTPGTRSGLLLGEQTLVPLTRSDATLRLPRRAAAELLPPGTPVTPEPGVDVVQFPVLARDGELLASARQLGDRRWRAAACITPGGHFLVGRIEHDTVAPIVSALLEEGCNLVVALDRGSHHPARVERGNVDASRQSDESALYVVGRALLPRAYVFE